MVEINCSDELKITLFSNNYEKYRYYFIFIFKENCFSNDPKAIYLFYLILMTFLILLIFLYIISKSIKRFMDAFVNVFFYIVKALLFLESIRLISLGVLNFKTIYYIQFFVSVFKPYILVGVLHIVIMKNSYPFISFIISILLYEYIFVAMILIGILELVALRDIIIREK